MAKAVFATAALRESSSLPAVRSTVRGVLSESTVQSGRLESVRATDGRINPRVVSGKDETRRW
jgi:hypothetical protein